MSTAAALEDVRASSPDGQRGRRSVSLGAVLDAALPLGGLPVGALHEVSGLAATSAVAAMARRALRHGGSVVWCRDRQLAGELGVLDRAGLARFGLAETRLKVVATDGEAESADAFEEALGRPSVACAVVELGRWRLPIGRRLRRAAAASTALSLVLRPEFDPLPNAALTRWRAEPGRMAGEIAWRLTLWHAAGALPGTFFVRWDERQASFAPAPS